MVAVAFSWSRFALPYHNGSSNALPSALLFSDLPTGFKRMDLPVVRFDSVRSIGKKRVDGSELGDDEREFTIHPEGTLCSLYVFRCAPFLTVINVRAYHLIFIPSQSGQTKWESRQSVPVFRYLSVLLGQSLFIRVKA